jgi:hypothetical protein
MDRRLPHHFAAPTSLRIPAAGRYRPVDDTFSTVTLCHWKPVKAGCTQRSSNASIRILNMNSCPQSHEVFQNVSAAMAERTNSSTTRCQLPSTLQAGPEALVLEGTAARIRAGEPIVHELPGGHGCPQNVSGASGRRAAMFCLPTGHPFSLTSSGGLGSLGLAAGDRRLANPENPEDKG